MRVPNWIRFSLDPDEVIGEHNMLRWWLLPQNRLFNVYLHKHEGDDPRVPHDHPADNLSVLLSGELMEHTPVYYGCYSSLHNVNHDRVVFFSDYGKPWTAARLLERFHGRRAEDVHRLTLVHRRTAWTLWIWFRNRRQNTSQAVVDVVGDNPGGSAGNMYRELCEEVCENAYFMLARLGL